MEITLDPNKQLQPKQLLAFKTSYQHSMTFYGGAKGGGKSYSMRFRQVYRRFQFAGTKGLIIRRSLPELQNNHLDKIFIEYPFLFEFYDAQKKRINFPNRSILQFSYLSAPRDVYNYQGSEYEDIDIDEVTQHTEETIKVLRSSNRTSNFEAVQQGLKPSMFLTGNPLDVGHAWVKRLFIDRRFKKEEKPKDYAFISANVYDNKILLETNPEYIAVLEALPELQRKAYLFGDWNIVAGQVFDNLVREVHVIDPIALPLETKYFAGYDHGYNHPFSFTLFAIVPDGAVYIIKHFTGRKRNPSEIASGILQLTKGLGSRNRLLKIHAGLDIWNKLADGSPEIVTQLKGAGLNVQNGYIIVKANTDRVQGVAEIRKLLQPDRNKIPRLKIFKNCLECFDILATRQFNPLRPEDVLKTDANEDGEGGDDNYDSIRYGIMGDVAPARIKKPEDQNILMPIINAHLRNKQSIEERTKFHH